MVPLWRFIISAMCVWFPPLADVLVTCNTKDFAESPFPVMTPEQFLASA